MAMQVPSAPLLVAGLPGLPKSSGGCASMGSDSVADIMQYNPDGRSEPEYVWASYEMGDTDMRQDESP